MIGIVIAFIVLAVVFGTCCIGGVLLIIPFVVAVVRLPITVFLRSYSLLYLAQYGAALDVFRVEESPGTNA